MTETESMLSRIQKLLAKAESAGALGSMEEALAFAEKAQELMTKHRLSEDQVRASGGDPIGEGWFNPFGNAKPDDARRVDWVVRLGISVASHNGCVCLFATKSSCMLKFVGRQSDREVAEYLVKTLVEQAERLGRRHHREVYDKAFYAGTERPQQARMSFILGFVVAVRERLRAYRDVVAREYGRHALVRLDNDLLDAQEWLNAKKRNIKETQLKFMSAADARSYQAGHTAGQGVAIHGGLEQDKRITKRLGGGK